MIFEPPQAVFGVGEWSLDFKRTITDWRDLRSFFSLSLSEEVPLFLFLRYSLRLSKRTDTWLLRVPILRTSCPFEWCGSTCLEDCSCALCNNLFLNWFFIWPDFVSYKIAMFTFALFTWLNLWFYLFETFDPISINIVWHIFYPNSWALSTSMSLSSYKRFSASRS